MDDDCMDLLRREKEHQEKSKAYYDEHYTIFLKMNSGISTIIAKESRLH